LPDAGLDLTDAGCLLRPHVIRLATARLILQRVGEVGLRIRLRLARFRRSLLGVLIVGQEFHLLAMSTTQDRTSNTRRVHASSNQKSILRSFCRLALNAWPM